MHKKELQKFLNEEYQKQKEENEEDLRNKQPQKRLRSQKYDVKNCRIIAFYAEKGK
jgi:hypothetical protein